MWNELYSLSCRFDPLDHRQDGRRIERHGAHPGAEGFERVFDGAREGCCHRNCAALTDTFDTERIGARAAFHVMDLDRRALREGFAWSEGRAGCGQCSGRCGGADELLDGF